MTNKNDSDREGEREENGLSDELMSSGRDYFASDFPNPDRIGCPPQSELLALARTGELPDDELRVHLFSCSACFTEFRAAVPVPSSGAGKRWWQGFFSTSEGLLRPVLTTLVLLSVLASVALVYLRSRREPQVTEQAGGARVGTTEQSAPPIEASPVAGSSPELLALVTTAVDLRDYVPLGSVERDHATSQRDSKQIRLAAVRTTLRLRLPQGSTAGPYTVSILDRSTLRSLISAKGSSANGDSFEATLSLALIAPNEYVMRVARVDEAPSDYLLVVYRR